MSKEVYSNLFELNVYFLSAKFVAFINKCIVTSSVAELKKNNIL